MQAEVEAARWANKRPALIAGGMDEATFYKNMLRCLLWDCWTKEQALQIIEKTKQMKGNEKC